MKRLEEQHFFPIIAWMLVIGLALFTYSLVVKLNKAVDVYIANNTHFNP